MCISIACASAFPKSAMRSVSEPSVDWGTDWRYGHESGGNVGARRPPRIFAGPLKRNFDRFLFSDGRAVSRHRSCPTPLPGTGDQLAAWSLVVRPGGIGHI